MLNNDNDTAMAMTMMTITKSAQSTSGRQKTTIPTTNSTKNRRKKQNEINAQDNQR